MFAFIVISLFLFSLPGSIFFSMFTIFPYFNGNLAGEGGMNVWLAKGISMFFTLAIVYGSYNIFSFSKERRNKGIRIICLSLPVFFAVMYFMTKDYNFNPSSGESMVNISETPDGAKRVPKSWKYDPTYGNRTMPADSQNIRKVIDNDAEASEESVDRYLPPQKELSNLKRTLEGNKGD